MEGAAWSDRAALLGGRARPQVVPARVDDCLIKWNPRTTDVAAVAARLDADAPTHWETPRAGKRVTLWEQAVSIEGIQRPVRRVLRLIERCIDKHGQVLIVPELTLEDWTTSLAGEQFSAAAIIALYADHGTHEQLHSEFKTDLDLVNLIANTTTRAGLKIRAELDRGKYPTGIKITDAELALLNLKQDNFHGDWNYTVLPARKKT